MTTDEEKAVLAAKGLFDFFGQFGDDESSRMMLEVLLEGLFNEEAVFVFGQQKQERNQTDYDLER